MAAGVGTSTAALIAGGEPPTCALQNYGMELIGLKSMI